MPYRKDKFKVGDMVTWSDEHYGNLTDGIKSYGYGPFIIETVNDRDYESGYDDEPSNWSSMGHTQHVIIDAAKDRSFSGAFFKNLVE